MSAGEIIDQIRLLPADERRQVVERIWEEFAADDLTVTPAQAAELDRRLAEHRQNPQDVVAWQEIKAATEAKYRRES